jgi:putative hemolysin
MSDYIGKRLRITGTLEEMETPYAIMKAYYWFVSSSRNVEIVGEGLANPASTYCTEQGYTLDIRKDAYGSETGYCVFPLGECEEWAFFRGECTDVERFTAKVVEGGLPDSAAYTEYFAEWGGVLKITTKDAAGNETVLVSEMPKESFTKFIKMAKSSGFERLNGTYPGPLGGGYARLSMAGQGKEKSAVAHPTNAPEAFSKVYSEFLALFENRTFSAPSTCLACGEMTKTVCETAGGHWNECASVCRNAPPGTACILMCVQQCECGGIAGWGCPAFYTCTDYEPAGAQDAMGVCRVGN